MLGFESSLSARLLWRGRTSKAGLRLSTLPTKVGRLATLPTNSRYSLSALHNSIFCRVRLPTGVLSDSKNESDAMRIDGVSGITDGESGVATETRYYLLWRTLVRRLRRLAAVGPVVSVSAQVVTSLQCEHTSRQCRSSRVAERCR